jgi:hypothetical protein
MAGTLTIGRHIHECSTWLGEHLVSVANEALSAHEEQKYSLAVTKAGSCLEGVLSQLLREWQTGEHKARTLGPLIGEVRESGKAPTELLERLNEAVVIRNRAPHNQPHALQTVTEGDAFQLLNILDLVVCWRNSGIANVSADPAEGLPIFLSTGRPHRLDQDQFLHRLRTQMRLLDVNLLTLSALEYSPDRPFDQIRTLMTKCRGALVVGLERSRAYTVFEREDSDDERLHQNQIIPTAWNQIEGSMASALELPILVLRQSGLHHEGIFEASHHRHQIRDFALTAECKGLTAELSAFLKGWVEAVRAGRA